MAPNAMLDNCFGGSGHKYTATETIRFVIPKEMAKSIFFLPKWTQNSTLYKAA